MTVVWAYVERGHVVQGFVACLLFSSFRISFAVLLLS